MRRCPTSDVGVVWSVVGWLHRLICVCCAALGGNADAMPTLQFASFSTSNP